MDILKMFRITESATRRENNQSNRLKETQINIVQFIVKHILQFYIGYLFIYGLWSLSLSAL